MLKKRCVRLLAPFLLLALCAGCAPGTGPQGAASGQHAEAGGEKYSYERLEETPPAAAYQAIEAIYPQEGAAPMDEGFYEEAVLWRCTAEKGITIHFGQEGLQASAVVDICEYRGYSAVYSVIQYGFSHPDHLEPVDETWVNVTNSQTQGQAPDVTIGVTVDSEDFDKPILAVCSLYPDVRDA
ncbi:MAG: hypothetical protein ACLVAA_12560 [Ruthenibacterium sp.]